jgi:enoyl-CoA hydratase/carnithine racemase
MADGGQARVLLERHGPVLRIGLNRPEKRNAADRAMLTALAAAYTELERDDALRVGVVWAAGEHFTAGLDLADVAPAMAGGTIDFRSADQLDPWGLTGPERTKPIVVAVQGACLTLGVELILAAEIAVAADTASFGQIEVSRGILPFGGATVRLPAAIGRGDAMRWMLTGERFDAEEALRVGLVQQVVPAGTELSTATAIAERIAAQPPLAVQAVLRNARLAAREGEAVAIAALPGELAALARTDDAAEGARALAERREPRYTGH